jgi:hypothetical protein
VTAWEHGGFGRWLGHGGGTLRKGLVPYKRGLREPLLPCEDAGLWSRKPAFIRLQSNLSAPWSWPLAPGTVRQSSCCLSHWVCSILVLLPNGQRPQEESVMGTWVDWLCPHCVRSGSSCLTVLGSPGWTALLRLIYRQGNRCRDLEQRAWRHTARNGRAGSRRDARLNIPAASSQTTPPNSSSGPSHLQGNLNSVCFGYRQQSVVMGQKPYSWDHWQPTI